ncbi:MAG: flagellar biosynthetic protein FliR [Methylococcaceae bacterium]|nr:flagellar biosynthetic protein FliR [Methylococcaceae bacterium]
MSITEGQILSTLASFFWPFIRIGSMFISIPIFSIRALPAKIRVIVALFITLVVVPLLPSPPNIEIFSYQGFMVALQQLVIGLSTGFVLQMVFSVMLLGGQSIAYSMGLGFASMVDPASGVQVPVVSQVFIVSANLMFLSVNGHLLLIEMLVESFNTLPVGIIGLNLNDLWSIISWSSQIFAGGVLLAMPIMAALLFVNISFGVAARAAPQIQIFAVGIPITIMLGLVLIWISMSNSIEIFSNVLTEGYQLIQQLLKL